MAGLGSHDCAVLSQSEVMRTIERAIEIAARAHAAGRAVRRMGELVGDAELTRAVQQLRYYRDYFSRHDTNIVEFERASNGNIA